MGNSPELNGKAGQSHGTLSHYAILAFQLVIFFEMVLFLPINLFFIMEDRGFLQIGDVSWFYFFAIPICFVIIAGFALQSEKLIPLLKRCEKWFDLSICAINYSIVAILLYDDKFNPVVPGAVYFVLWVSLFGLILTNGLIRQVIGMPVQFYSQNGHNYGKFVVLICFVYLGIAAIVNILAIVIYFFVLSGILHAIGIFAGIRGDNKNTSLPPPVIKQSVSANLFQFIFLILTLLVAWDLLGWLWMPVGDPILNYAVLPATFFDLLFFSGAVVALLTERLDRVNVGNFLAVVLTLLTLTNSYIFAPLLLGYVLFALIFFLSRRTPRVLGLAFVLVTLTMVGGLYLLFDNATLQKAAIYVPIFQSILTIIVATWVLSILTATYRARFQEKIAIGKEPDLEGE